MIYLTAGAVFLYCGFWLMKMEKRKVELAEEIRQIELQRDTY